MTTVSKYLNLKASQAGIGFAQGTAMKRIPNRIWVLVLGVAVAIGIATAAFFFKDQQPSTFSVTPGQKSVPSTSAAKLVKETLKKIHRTNLPTQ